MYKDNRRKKARRKSDRHTMSTIAAFEDAVAILMGISLFSMRALRFITGRLRRARNILNVARNDPNAYDTNQRSDEPISTRKVK